MQSNVVIYGGFLIVMAVRYKGMDSVKAAGPAGGSGCFCVLFAVCTRFCNLYSLAAASSGELAHYALIIYIEVKLVFREQLDESVVGVFW